MDAMRKKALLIAGGDLRMLYAARQLCAEFDVRLLGFCPEQLPPDVESLREIIEKTVETCGKPVERADILLLPPVTADAQGKIPAPLGECSLDPETVLSQAEPGGLVLLGNDRTGRVRQLCAEKKLNWKDYINSDALAQANAVPTAEGALKIALEETGRTIWGSRVLVTGCGRIGTILTARLHALGAQVTAAARRESDRVRMETMGVRSAAIPLDSRGLSEYDVIFNTVPAEIFQETHLCALRADSPLIELASAPGGADESAVKRSGCRYVRASGLPRYVPC
ncbi:MAG: hypothetical protein IJ512_01445 [Ruminococcus sp.]|nr:hypothetical protein [Ruminococcus sp.]